MGHSRKDPHLGSPQKKWKMTLLGQPNLPPPSLDSKAQNYNPPWTSKISSVGRVRIFSGMISLFNIRLYFNMGLFNIGLFNMGLFNIGL